MKVIIRKIKHSDYLGIIDLYNEIYKKNIMYHDININNDKNIIVIEIESKIIGCIEINILNNEIENYKYSYITNIIINSKYQSQSMINLIIQACTKISENNNCKKIILNIPNNQNYETYKKNNFKQNNNIILTKDLN